MSVLLKNKILGNVYFFYLCNTAIYDFSEILIYKNIYMINSGEVNELLVKLNLVKLRDEHREIKLYNGSEYIKSVGFKGTEYLSLPQNVNLTSIAIQANSGNPVPLEMLANAVGIIKAGVYDKADVYINNIGYSVKSLQGAPPALVNHTARDGWERACLYVKENIQELDQIIAEYWDKRCKGIINEDVRNNSPESPFRNHKSYLIKVLNYFLFIGSGSKLSPSPAEYILEFDDPLNIDTWSIYKDEYLDRFWDKLIFSLRSNKGMGNYPNIKNPIKKLSMSKWTVLFDGAYKGALHVRVGK